MCKNKYKQNKYKPSNNLCESDQHWYDLWEIKDDLNTVRVNGVHYIIGEPNAKFKGMGGARVEVVFNDGRVVVTDNLWHQGKIPKHWQELGMQNNATFGKV